MTYSSISCVPHQLKPSRAKVEAQSTLTFDFNDLINRLIGIRNNSIPRSDEIESFKINYLINELKDKYPIGEHSLPEKEKREAGLKKLVDANEQCRRFNEEGYLTDEISSGALSSILQVAANKVRIWLGEFTYDVYKHSAFSNGATTCRSYQFRDPYFKYTSSGDPITVSGRALSRLRSLINATPLWVEHGGQDNIAIYNYDKVTFVPKNSTELRAIVPQQSGLVCLQKGLAYALKRALKRLGNGLDDQSRNQVLSYWASVRQSHATIDLKNASALMNYRVVWDLLPDSWFKEFDALRNTHGKLPDGSTIKWEMFSSMGNGYNFELESLVFLALVTAASEHLGDYVGNISVYGDDIIVPSSTAQFCCAVLRAVGFNINEKKTHFSGPFRESCGAHWYKGVDVKPFYIKKEVLLISDYIRLLNRIRKWATVDGIGVCDPRYYTLWKSYANAVPSYLYGGRDVEVDYAVVTAHQPRERLVRKLREKPINGWRALMRYWQNQNHVCRISPIEVIETSSSNHSISIAETSWFLVRENYDDNVEVALFPQEGISIRGPNKVLPDETIEENTRRRKAIYNYFATKNLPVCLQFWIHKVTSMF